MPLVTVNFWAILVAAILNMAIGAFWYSTSGFGKTWMSLVGMSKEKMEAGKKEAGKYYIVSFVGALIMAYVLSHIIAFAQVDTIFGGIQTGFLVWLGFVVTTSLGDYLFADRPKKLYVLNNGYYLVSLCVMGAVLAVWV